MHLLRTTVPALVLIAAACSGSTTSETAGSGGGGATGTGGGGTGAGGEAACLSGSESLALDPTLFASGGLASAITEEACTLSNGAASTCYRIELAGAPSNHAVGPFCPTNINDTADKGGIWIESGTAYDVDGAFIKNLATFYNDPVWQLYDEATGDIRVTDTQEACAAAAQPMVDPAYNNYCVECSLDYVGGGVVTALLIPKVPVARAAPSELGMSKVGASLSGVTFDPPAPTDAILAAHTIAAFDDCGGHVNLVAGYHYHAATGCSLAVATCDQHAPLLGYAMDGYAIYAMADEGGTEPADLDACRGHEDAARGYHYHVASPGENLFIGCFHGEIAGTATGGGMECAPGQVSMCCGDGVCDGPETPANCAADCP